ncbi:MAG: polyprenyl synthetase family protein [Pirellulales bacterium]
MSVALPTTAEPTALDWERFRPPVDEALSRYARFDADCPAHLAEAIRYALLGPGKRLRPQLVLMGAEACGGNIEEAMPAACAVEMIHAYSLVHDDLPAMDDDDLRRGRPTCHKVYGEAVAILVGDALQARAFELLATEITPPAVAAKCCAVLGRAAGASALVGGQAADLAGSEQGELMELEAIHRRKTGALFVASLELGGIVAGATARQLAMLVEFGRKLGLAFQITDDLLDVTANQAAVGKRVAKDEDHGNLTFPKLFGVVESRRRAAELIDEACLAIEPFGLAGESLRSLARFVASRNN